MAAMWPSSGVPFLDQNGAPYSGARAFFYDSGTLTPQTVYRDPALGEVHDNPVQASGSGIFPAVYLQPGLFKVRLTDANGAVLFEADGVSVPDAAGGGGGGGGGGDTEAMYLYQTGDLKARYGTGSLAGYVRSNGRSIGSAASGATERANADTEALFVYLWTADASLAVSGGRGSTANGDYAANKRINLPDWRGAPLVGLDGMGSTRANLLTDGTADTLGALVGSSTRTLVTANLPPYTPSGSINRTQNGQERTAPNKNGFAGGSSTGGFWLGPDAIVDLPTQPAFSFAGNAQGGTSTPFSVVQPSRLCTIYIKL